MCRKSTAVARRVDRPAKSRRIAAAAHAPASDPGPGLALGAGTRQAAAMANVPHWPDGVEPGLLIREAAA